MAFWGESPHSLIPMVTTYTGVNGFPLRTLINLRAMLPKRGIEVQKAKSLLLFSVPVAIGFGAKVHETKKSHWRSRPTIPTARKSRASCEELRRIHVQPPQVLPHVALQASMRPTAASDSRGVDSYSFQPWLFSQTSPFPQVFWWFSRKKDPWKELGSCFKRFEVRWLFVTTRSGNPTMGCRKKGHMDQKTLRSFL